MIKAKDQGAVALITTMIISILLLITTSGMVALTLKSLRGSTDGAQSTKAYYAAEGGLEEALLKLRNGDISDSCPGANAADSAQNGAVTCTKITSNPNQVQGTIAEGETKQIDLSGVSGLQTVVVEWTVPEGVVYDAAKIPKYIDPAGNNNFPTKGDDWPTSAAAVIEAGIVDYPDGQIGINEVNFYQATLTPKSSSAGHTSNSIPGNGSGALANLYTYNDNNVLQKPSVVTCDKPAPYQCKAAAVGLQSKPNNKRILRLKARYNGASYRVSVLGAGNAQLTIPGAVYTIDVTARAGDTFRRIQTSIPIGAPTPSTVQGLDYVLYSDTDICKSFEIRGGAASGLSCQAPVFN